MSQTVDVAVQPTNDPNTKAYHCRHILAPSMEEGARGNFDGLGSLGQMFLDIPGVVHVTLGPYLCLVTKAALFEWKEVEPRVEEILREFAISQRLLDVA